MLNSVPWWPLLIVKHQLKRIQSLVLESASVRRTRRRLERQYEPHSATLPFNRCQSPDEAFSVHQTGLLALREQNKCDALGKHLRLS